jgi:hypothetical protein
MLESASGLPLLGDSGLVRQSIGIQDNRACYNRFMLEAPPHKEISIKLIRDGQAEPFDDEWDNSSPEERIEGVWTLTKICLAWNNHLTDEPRLQRNITRIQRSSR